MARKRPFILGSIMIGVTVAAACSDERAITTEPVGALGFGINLAKQATNLPRGVTRFPSAVPSATIANDSLIVSLRGLDALPAGSQYRVWVADDSSSTWFPATNANLRITRVDTTFNAAGDPVFPPAIVQTTGVTGFSNGGSNVAVRFATSRAAITGVAATNIGVVLVTIETTPNPTTPSTERRILWSRRSQRFGAGGGANDSAGVNFGTFGRSLATQYLYSTSNAASVPSLAINPRGRVEVRGSIMVVDDSNYTRPPRGFYYAAYAVKFDTLRGRFSDTVYLGRRTTPFPEQISLFDADFGGTNPAPAIVLEPQQVILGMRTRVSADSLPKAITAGRPWREFGLVVITLQSKNTVEGSMGSSIVTQAFLPQSVRGR